MSVSVSLSMVLMEDNESFNNSVTWLGGAHGGVCRGERGVDGVLNPIDAAQPSRAAAMTDVISPGFGGIQRDYCR